MRRILLIGPDIRDPSRVSNYTGVWAYNLAKEFRAAGIEVRCEKGSDKPLWFEKVDLTGVDHVLALGLRYFSERPPECAKLLRKRCAGKVAQLHDTARHDPCDVTFTTRAVHPEDAERNVSIGWAADPEAIKPAQDDVLTILIDHSHYSAALSVRDYSRQVLMQVAEFVKSEIWRDQWPAVRVRRLVDGGAEDVDLSSLTVPVFTRKHVPFEVMAAEYGRAHVFMPTHPESVGLTVLETAMAGALTVTPKVCIQPELLATVRHSVYETEPNWREVLAKIDIAKSRKKAMANSWQAVAGRIIKHLWR